MRENFYEGKVMDMWFEDGVFCGIYKVEHVDIRVAETATQERLDFVRGVPYPSMADYSIVKSTSKEARDYFATEPASKYITAMAVLTTSSLGKIIVNFYLNINKPAFPTRIFTNKAEAFTWLNQYKANKL